MSLLGWAKEKLGFEPEAPQQGEFKSKLGWFDWLVPDAVEKPLLGSAPTDEFKSKLPFWLDYLIPDSIEKPVTNALTGTAGLFSNPMSKLEEWTGIKIPNWAEKGGDLLLHGALLYGAFKLLSSGWNMMDGFFGTIIGLAIVAVALPLLIYAGCKMLGDGFGLFTGGQTIAQNQQISQGLGAAGQNQTVTQAKATPDQVENALSGISVPDGITLTRTGTIRPASISARGAAEVSTAV